MANRRRSLLPICLAAMLLTACGGDDGTAPTTTADSPGATLIGTLLPSDTVNSAAPPVTSPVTSPVTTIPPTTAASTTTPTTAPAAAPTTTAVPTTTIDPANDVILSAVGVGSHAFGTAPGPLLEDFNARFGVPDTDDTMTFVSTSDGYVSDDGCCSFTAAAARTICWPNGLCITFGGSNSESVGFVGWQYQGDEFSSLHTAAGITLGSRWSNFLTAMSAEPGGCYTVGYGSTTDGIDLTLEGGDFSLVSDGEITNLVPPPEQVTVLAMSSGDQILDLASDC